MNEMQLKGKKSTRKGSGITENKNLCHKCYENVQKNILIIYYSPIKRQQNVVIVITFN